MSNRNTLSVRFDVQDYWGLHSVTGKEVWARRLEFEGYATLTAARKAARDLRKRSGKGARTRIIRTTREVVKDSK